MSLPLRRAAPVIGLVGAPRQHPARAGAGARCAEGRARASTLCHRGARPAGRPGGGLRAHRHRAAGRRSASAPAGRRPLGAGARGAGLAAAGRLRLRRGGRRDDRDAGRRRRPDHGDRGGGGPRRAGARSCSNRWSIRSGRSRRAICAITNITNAMVRDAPPLRRGGRRRLLAALAGRVFVAHNAAVRLELRERGAAAGPRPRARRARLCTVRLARRLVKGVRSCGLDNLTPASSASRTRPGTAPAGDALVTAELLCAAALAGAGGGRAHAAGSRASIAAPAHAPGRRRKRSGHADRAAGGLVPRRH